MKWGRAFRAMFVKSDAEEAAERTQAMAEQAEVAMDKIRAAARDVAASARDARGVAGGVIRRVEESR